MVLKYTSIPTVSQFRKDSNVALAIRGNDQMLHAMDRALEKLAKASDDRMAITADLFFTINSWIKLYHEKARGIERGRYPAVSALSEAVQDELAKMYGVKSRNHLARKLHEMFGAQITYAGLRTDASKQATIFTRAQRETKRIYFEGGKMKRYMADLPEDGRGGLQLLNSMQFAQQAIFRLGAGTSLRGFAPFVMSMEREFYMSIHNANQGGVFHSAYFNGVVAMAGTMLVENGVLKAIRGDSGHYQPNSYKMVNALRALRARGVNLRGVTVYDYMENAPTHNGRAMGKTPMIQTPGRAPPVPPRLNMAQTTGRAPPVPPRPNMGQQPPEFYANVGSGGGVYPYNNVNAIYPYNNQAPIYPYNNEVAMDAELYMA